MLQTPLNSTSALDPSFIIDQEGVRKRDVDNREYRVTPNGDYAIVHKPAHVCVTVTRRIMQMRVQ